MHTLCLYKCYLINFNALFYINCVNGWVGGCVRYGSSTWTMYLSTRLKNRGQYKYKYFVKNSRTSAKYFENFSQVQSNTLNAIFMFHNGSWLKR